MTYRCRACGTPLKTIFADLGRSPPSNAFRTVEQLDQPEYTLPLRVYVCNECQLVQMPAYDKREQIFNENYAYFTSTSPTAVKHAEDYVVAMARRLHLNGESLVVEVASNDGYLLQHFKDLDVPVLGVEPALNVADIALKKGINTYVDFFGEGPAEEIKSGYGRADLIHAANVLAHVPNIHDFVSGFKILLKPQGTITFEFPHLLNLIKGVQLDTIYHEHYSYLSLWALEPIFSQHDLRVYDVEYLPTHGGSLRLYVCHEDAQITEVSTVNELRAQEALLGIGTMEYYASFASAIVSVKQQLLKFLLDRQFDGHRVAGYGAPAKATTLLNYCGIDQDLIKYTTDLSPSKIGKFIPGTHIPIVDESVLFKNSPDYLLIFPWNLKASIVPKLHPFLPNTKFVTAIPKLVIF